MRASRRGARDLLVAASRSNARSASYRGVWLTAVRLASTSAARGCASWTSPARRCRHRALGARGFAADAADEHPPTACWACAAPFGASAEHRFFCDACGEILPARVAAPTRGADGAAPLPRPRDRAPVRGGPRRARGGDEAAAEGAPPRQVRRPVGARARAQRRSGVAGEPRVRRAPRPAAQGQVHAGGARREPRRGRRRRLWRRRRRATVRDFESRLRRRLESSGGG